MFLISSGLTQLNSSLDDIDIRYNAVSGKPEWRERGAGSFVPFESGLSYDCIIWDSHDYDTTSKAAILIHDGEVEYFDGTVSSLATKIATNYDWINNVSVGGSGNSALIITIKEGWYATSMGFWNDAETQYYPCSVTPYHFSNNKQLTGFNSWLVYYGDTNPT